jgi:AAA ATPase domain
VRTASDPDIVGREAEIQALRDFLDQIPHKFAALVLVGDAGIGKTALLKAAVSSAKEHDYLVLSCGLAEAETRLSFAGLADLFLDAIDDDVRGSLPEPQRQALDVVFSYRTPGRPRSTSERSRPRSSRRCERSHRLQSVIEAYTLAFASLVAGSGAGGLQRIADRLGIEERRGVLG